MKKPNNIKRAMLPLAMAIAATSCTSADRAPADSPSESIDILQTPDFDYELLELMKSSLGLKMDAHQESAWTLGVQAFCYDVQIIEPNERVNIAFESEKPSHRRHISEGFLAVLDSNGADPDSVNTPRMLIYFALFGEQSAQNNPAVCDVDFWQTF